MYIYICTHVSIYIYIYVNMRRYHQGVTPCQISGIPPLPLPTSLPGSDRLGRRRAGPTAGLQGCRSMDLRWLRPNIEADIVTNMLLIFEAYDMILIVVY